ncbi:uncharacterized protein LOC102208681 isoform X1 [Pundamilia nyererei]|uniref:Uncharacterized protein LOC102208681 isoform X1 n=1 Tax=Pundamilia nyererei TaxID=303518 RepID=A0A9Y3S0Q7_9CICH|nr:PREDICTED: uncharacterized protein LOC102208681 isoform X1 [Pundamilia nyererei]XP_005754330.1 PREDICTED: uncharacterized protein LOC102208681 isoform X1 [Pundamilia nyererei]
MSAGTYLGLCLSLLVIRVSLGSAASDQQILRHPGMSVNLTFQVPTDTTSVWLKRLEKYKDNDKYISYCQDSTPTRPSDQEESIKGRVEGMDCSNISGTVSVTLKNLTSNDSGTYELQGVDHSGRYFNRTVFLNVTDPGQPGGDTEDGGKEAGGKEAGGKEAGGKEAGASREHPGLAVSLFCFFVVVCGCVCAPAAIKWLINCCKKNSPFSPPSNNESDRETKQITLIICK